MSVQSNFIRIDIRMSDTVEHENSGTSLNYRQVEYSAIDEVRSIRVSKTYTKASEQNSIDFVNYLMKKVAISIQLICTDNSLMFQGGFEEHLMKLGLRHERLSPYKISDPDLQNELR